MDNTVAQALGVILVLFFIFTMVMSAKNQAWYNILIAFCVFGASIYLIIEAAFVLKTRKNWREIHNNLAKQLEPEVKKTQALTVGSAENANDPFGTLPKASGEFERVMTNRGRVWKGCTTEQVQPTQIVLNTPASAPPPPAAPVGAPPAMPPADPNAPPADPAAAPAAPADGPLEVRPNGIKEKSILYVFKENKLTDTIAVPFYYLGEWEVVAATDTNVTLKPTIPLDVEQQAQLNAGGTFTIYEMLPIDATSSYDEYFAQAKAERTEEQLRALIPKLPQTDPKVQALYDKAYDAMIQRYVRDGKEATEDDKPEQVWVQVKFLKTKDVTVDSATTQVTKDSPFYDASGLAILPNLRAEGQVKFKAGETGVFKKADAEALIAEGVCEKVSLVYRRPLNDYKYHFHEIYNRMDYLVNRIAEVKRQTVTITTANLQIEKVIESLRETKGKLESDEKKFKAEVVAIKAYAVKLENYRDATRQRVRDLYMSNIALANEIADRQKKLTDDINQKTLQAATNAK